jgi:hypothetical protein
MSMADWLKQLFGREGNESKKINTLSERRAKLAQRRDQIYEDITKLERREADLLAQGRENPSPTVKRRVATQIKQLREDMARHNASARMLGQQVEIISTHIHNLTLIQQGKSAKLPTTEAITEDAVRAEEMLEQLNSETQLAGSLSTGADESLTSEEELAILKELEETPEPDDRSGSVEVEPGEPPLSQGDRNNQRREPEAE